MDPMSLIMLAMIGLLIVFMVRNGKKRRAQQEQMQQGIQPGAEVMIQSGIFGTVESVGEADDPKVTILSGTSTLVVHRNAIVNIVTPTEVEAADELAPDDDPEFNERLSASDTDDSEPNSDDADSGSDDTDKK